MEYNNAQRRAILHKDGPMLVLAGPGSGKTAVITERTTQLIEHYGVEPSHILVITFTRAAAREMKERFLAAAPEEGKRVTFGTFHAVFFTVLKMAYRFTADNIVSEEQRFLFLRQILSYQQIECRDENELIGDLLTEIGRVKNEQIPLEHFYSACCGEEVFRTIYRAYTECLNRNRLLDFDDMLTYTYELFAQRKDILSAWQNKYQYILIDEFQDINPIQWKIMQMLAAPQDHLFVVGDDDQSIYRFRGSKPEIMLGFKKLYPHAETVVLDQNYRCSPQIVQAAGKLIAHNKNRYKKQVQAVKTDREAVQFCCFEDIYKENAFLAEDIKKAVRMGTPLSEIAVLFRTNRQPRALLEYLLSQNVPFYTKDRIPDLYSHWIAKDLFTYIRIAQGSDSRADFFSVMNRPKRYIGRDSLPEPHVSFEAWMAYYEKQPWIAERIEKLWYDLKHVSRLSPYAAINYIRHGIGYDDYLADYADYRNVQKDELYEIADELQAGAKGYSDYAGWREHIEEYRRELKRAANDGRKDGLTCATLHSAKGLEFTRVYIIDASEGVMPYKKAVLPADLEEERRLFYVGMTRAKETLVICSVKNLRGREVQPSRFLQEAGWEECEKDRS